MSRHTILNVATGRTIVYGYDDPLQEYFLTEYMSLADRIAWKEANKQELEGLADPDAYVPEVRFSIMSYNTTDPHPDFPGKLHWSNGEILELMQKYPEIPLEHGLAVVLDMTF